MCQKTVYCIRTLKTALFPQTPQRSSPKAPHASGEYPASLLVCPNPKRWRLGPSAIMTPFPGCPVDKTTDAVEKACHLKMRRSVSLLGAEFWKFLRFLGPCARKDRAHICLGPTVLAKYSLCRTPVLYFFTWILNIAAGKDLCYSLQQLMNSSFLNVWPIPPLLLKK